MTQNNGVVLKGYFHLSRKPRQWGANHFEYLFLAKAEAITLPVGGRGVEPQAGYQSSRIFYVHGAAGLFRAGLGTRSPPSLAKSGGGDILFQEILRHGVGSRPNISCHHQIPRGEDIDTRQIVSNVERSRPIGGGHPVGPEQILQGERGSGKSGQRKTDTVK